MITLSSGSWRTNAVLVVLPLSTISVGECTTAGVLEYDTTKSRLVELAVAEAMASQPSNSVLPCHQA